MLCCNTSFFISVCAFDVCVCEYALSACRACVRACACMCACMRVGHRVLKRKEKKHSVVLERRVLERCNGGIEAKLILARRLHEEHALSSHLDENVRQSRHNPSLQLVNHHAKQHKDTRASNTSAAMDHQRAGLGLALSFHAFDGVEELEKGCGFGHAVIGPIVVLNLSHSAGCFRLVVLEEQLSDHVASEVVRADPRHHAVAVRFC